jgi:hypothetical protein
MVTVASVVPPWIANFWSMMKLRKETGCRAVLTEMLTVQEWDEVNIGVVIPIATIAGR